MQSCLSPASLDLRPAVLELYLVFPPACHQVSGETLRLHSRLLVGHFRSQSECPNTGPVVVSLYSHRRDTVNLKIPPSVAGGECRPYCRSYDVWLPLVGCCVSFSAPAGFDNHQKACEEGFLCHIFTHLIICYVYFYYPEMECMSRILHTRECVV